MPIGGAVEMNRKHWMSGTKSGMENGTKNGERKRAGKTTIDTMMPTLKMSLTRRITKSRKKRAMKIREIESFNMDFFIQSNAILATPLVVLMTRRTKPTMLTAERNGASAMKRASISTTNLGAQSRLPDGLQILRHVRQLESSLTTRGICTLGSSAIKMEAASMSAFFLTKIAPSTPHNSPSKKWLALMIRHTCTMPHS